MQSANQSFIDDALFREIIANIPLVSLDIVPRNKGRVLLGKRRNKPAEGYWFTLGGRILKGERLHDAAKRIASEEIDLTLTVEPRFVGVFEHFYEDAIYEGVSTHYIDLVYEAEVDDLPTLPMEQHTEYRWFEVARLLDDANVHPYVKEIFTRE